MSKRITTFAIITIALFLCIPSFAQHFLGAFSGAALQVDTQIETTPQNNNTQTLPEQAAGDMIRFQLFVPSGGGRATNGYTVELDLPSKTFSSYIGTISGQAWTGDNLINTNSTTLSALFITGATVPSTGYLGQIDVQVTRPLEDGATLIVKSLSMTSGNDIDSLDVSNAVITFTAASACPGDFDGNGRVDIADFLAFVNVFGSSSSDANYNAQMDLDSNGSVNIADFLAFVNVFGTECGGGSGGGGSSSPDLIVESPSVSDNTLTTGQSFTLRATVRNRGNGSSASTTLRYYRSSDATISTSDTRVGTDSVGGLSASGTSAESISLSAPSSAGTYYYGACVESVSGENNTNNNCSDGVRVTVSSSSGGGGGTTYGVGQLLPNFPSGFFVPAQVSKASFQFSGGRAVLGFQNGGVIKLQDGTTYTCIASGGCSVEGGRVTAGTISVTTGSSGGGGGGGGSGSPDLIVDSPSVSDSTLTTGQSFTLRATVRNSGTGRSASTTLRYYRSSNSTISTSDTQVGTDSVSGLSASGTSAESISLNAPSSAGTYYYGACVNSVTGESDTGNNCSDGVRVTVSSSSGGGGGTTYGVGQLLPNFPSGFFVPAQVSKASFQFSGGRAVLGFQNGGVIKLQDGTTYTCIASGGCSVEGGRVTAGTISVTTGSSGGGGGGGGSGSPDLIVDSPSVSDSTLTTGQSFTLRATVRNSGTGRSASTTLRYYRSSNSTISTSDTQVGTDSVSGLSASGTSAESISLNAPSSAGTYYYGACVNSVTGESDTGNNCSSGVRVTVSSSSGGGTPPPSGNAVTGSITDCSSTQNGFIYNIRIAGTVRASRSVSSLLLQGYVGSSFVGISNLGSLSAGQSKSFTITGISGSQLSGRCRVDMTWLEGGNKSQGVVD